MSLYRSRGSIGGARPRASAKNGIHESTVKAHGLGGNGELAIAAVTGADQFEKISTFLTKGANFDKTNPGVPISCTIRHLTDSSQVKLALTTEGSSVTLVCNSGTWSYDGTQSFRDDAFCHGDENTYWTDGKNFLVTGDRANTGD